MATPQIWGVWADKMAKPTPQLRHSPITFLHETCLTFTDPPPHTHTYTQSHRYVKHPTTPPPHSLNMAQKLVLVKPSESTKKVLLFCYR